MYLPEEDTEVCNSNVQLPGTESNFLLLVERGNCTFTQKVLNAQMNGASGVIIYNSLRGMYRGKNYGLDKTDYECGNGEGWVENVVQPIWSTENEPEECTSDPRCDSGRCILTNITDSTKGTKACCAWDLYMSIGGDFEEAKEVRVPVAYITMSDADVLFSNTDLESGDLEATMFLRPWAYYNLSSFFLWALGVFTACIAAYHSSGDLRKKIYLMDNGLATPPSDDDDVDMREQSMNLTIWHTLGFIVLASSMLLILYYFDINLVITILYSFSCAAAVSVMLLKPLFKGFLGRNADEVCFVLPESFGGYISKVDFACLVVGPSLAVWWFLVRNTASYAWVLQDLFGVCLCVLFLSVIRFPNVKIAAVLLTLAFFYDIFFVFISPLIFENSVMVQVATGGEAKADPTYCEKYPDDEDCQTREQLPMLLLMPRINDYHGGYAMLGLGDIVLPGLLLAFALRYDTSRRQPLWKGYFMFMAVGYSVGLIMADVAVYWMQMGQPALLYLVPLTLGVFLLRAKMEGKLKEMWEGPKHMDIPAPLTTVDPPKQTFTNDKGQEKRPLLANI
eukprot:CAMPEP_0117755468 /NCGR_PEP_ID=MMETSP0947-20121206/13472_1 /TAXON_ID=44440 /ORGANISM="Chattonella subsalsa, Strain CCMP2191" /LENGTH=562 /DNA_ID=CAMNT_0005574813 /DNA_START=348 /DNA_END=2036 /DNA_ORIENTATION=-